MIRDLQEELNQIMSKYIGKCINRITREKIKADFTELLTHFELKDIKFAVVVNMHDNTFRIVGQNEMSKWALRGILAKT